MTVRENSVALLYQKLTFPFIFLAAKEINAKLILILHPDERSLAESIAKTYDCIGHIAYVNFYADEQKAMEEIRAVHHEHPFEMLISFREEAIPFAAKASIDLGLPFFNEPQVAFGARDKSRMRSLFLKAGCNVPKYAYNQDHDFEEAVRHLRFPVVVKPTSGFGSMGVVRANNETELAAGISAVSTINRETLQKTSVFEGKAYAGVIVEEYLSGAEFVVETFSVKGEHFVLLIGYKGSPQGPYFEESVYVGPTNFEKETLEKIELETIRCLNALGIVGGPCHIELRLNQLGEPTVLEIGARIGGSGVSHFTVKEATGLDCFGLCVQYLKGMDVTTVIKARKQNRYAGNYIVPIGSGGVFVGLNGKQRVQEHPDTRFVFEILRPGHVVRPYPEFSGYPGFVCSSHPSWQEAMDYVNFLNQNISATYE